MSYVDSDGFIDPNVFIPSLMITFFSVVGLLISVQIFLVMFVLGVIGLTVSVVGGYWNKQDKLKESRTAI